MTIERMLEIERIVFYRYLDRIVASLDGCENEHTIFEVGRVFGMMQNDFICEMHKEVKKDEKEQNNNL